MRLPALVPPVWARPVGVQVGQQVLYLLVGHHGIQPLSQLSAVRLPQGFHCLPVRASVAALAAGLNVLAALLHRALHNVERLGALFVGQLQFVEDVVQPVCSRLVTISGPGRSGEQGTGECGNQQSVFDHGYFSW